MPILQAVDNQDDLWRLLPAGPRRSLAQAAASEFGKRGYHATTTRHIAEHVGMSPAGLYVHYASKAELLFTISRIGHESVLNEIRSSVEGKSKPTERISSIVKSFTVWHAVNHMLARVLQYELHSLEPAHYRVIAGIRRQTENFVAKEIRTLISDDLEVRMCSLAVLSLGIDTARWYETGKSPGPEQLGDSYARMALRMLKQK